MIPMPTFWVLPIFAPVLLVLMLGYGGKSVWLCFLHSREFYPGTWELEVWSPDARLLP